MQLHSIRGGNKEELEGRKYTIGVGISLGNKWFTPENIVELVKWSLVYSKDYVIIYVADSIHAINLEVRNRISFQNALKKAEARGQKILDDVKAEVVSKLSPDEIKKIVYVTWSDLETPSYKEKVKYLKSLYSDDVKFKNKITSIVKGFTSKETRIFSDFEVSCLGEYLVEELPELLNRVPMDNLICDAYVCPYDGEVTAFIEKIQKGEIFPEIKKKIMDTEPKVFLEVR